MAVSLKQYRAGDSLEDYCRVCKTDRLHTVVAAGDDGRPIRVACGYCRSEHNFRGGPRIQSSTLSPPKSARSASSSPEERGRVTHGPFPIVSDRERITDPMTLDRDLDLEMLLRRIIREETGITAVAPAEKWRGGMLVLRPGTPGVQEKTWPIETFFHKVVMLRNRLRTLEQQVNAANLPDDVKVKLQSYISGCYGSLTSFNILFADETDEFRGTGGD